MNTRARSAAGLFDELVVAEVIVRANAAAGVGEVVR